jgi:hypothetical protein
MNIKRIPLRILDGRRVRLLRELRNQGGDVFPQDSIMVICDKWRGFSLCHPDGPRHGYIQCVAASSFQLLDDDFRAADSSASPPPESPVCAGMG